MRTKIHDIRVEILMLVGGLTHLTFFILGLGFKLYPLCLFSAVIACIMLCISFFREIRNIALLFILIYLEILANCLLLLHFYHTTISLHIYFIILLPISTFILPSISTQKKKLSFFIISSVINILSYMFFDLFGEILYPSKILLNHVEIPLKITSAISAGVMSSFTAFFSFMEMVNRFEMLTSERDLSIELAEHDDLTGLYNRRYMTQYLDDLYERSRYNHKKFCIAIADIDNFKSFNDTFGHEAGDIILKTITPFLYPLTFDPDNIVCRWGGEEFLFIIPHSNKIAKKLLEQIRSNIENLPLSYNDKNLKITMTFGISLPNTHHNSVQEMIADADKKLYLGKNTGKNCVII